VLGLREQGKTWKEAGAGLNVSAARASQIVREVGEHLHDLNGAQCQQCKNSIGIDTAHENAMGEWLCGACYRFPPRKPIGLSRG
jgi:hypothetical protein